METHALSLSELSRRLVEGRRGLDSVEAEWIAWLAEFDRRNGYAFEGHQSCVSWLVQTCGMGRSTAKDRLRVARELQHRPLIAEAFGDGSLSYSKVRALTRVEEADDEADRVFLQAAPACTADQLEQLVRHYKLCQEQETPPAGRLLDDRCVV